MVPLRSRHQNHANYMTPISGMQASNFEEFGSTLRGISQYPGFSHLVLGRHSPPHLPRSLCLHRSGRLPTEHGRCPSRPARWIDEQLRAPQPVILGSNLFDSGNLVGGNALARMYRTSWKFARESAPKDGYVITATLCLPARNYDAKDGYIYASLPWLNLTKLLRTARSLSSRDSLSSTTSRMPG